MSTLSKQTKAQLAEIADALGIDTAACRVKKDFYETVRDYFLEHEVDSTTPYYEIAKASRLLSPKKRSVVVVEEDEEDDSEGETEEEDDDDVVDEDDDEDEDEDEDDDEDDEDDEKPAGESFKDKFNDEVAKLKKKHSDRQKSKAVQVKKAKAEFILVVLLQAFLRYIRFKLIRAYFTRKSQELREYLSDPYSINDIVFVLESSFLLYTFTRFVPLTDVLGLSAQDHSFLSSIPVIDPSIFNKTFFTVVPFWFAISLVIPKITSYYVNFTYDFAYDSFIFSLAKLFVSLLVFKTTINGGNILTDLDLEFSDPTFVCKYAAAAKQIVFDSAVHLRGVFGNWVLINAAFTTLVALYANLAFV